MTAREGKDSGGVEKTWVDCGEYLSPPVEVPKGGKFSGKGGSVFFERKESRRRWKPMN